MFALLGNKITRTYLTLADIKHPDHAVLLKQIKRI
jgi:hypothetical protein